MWTPRVTVLFQVYAFMYVGVSRISGRCCGLMVGLSHGAHIIYNGAHSVGQLYQAQPSLGAERKRRTYTIRIRSEHYQHIAHRGLA